MKLNITVKEFKNLDINDKLNVFESRTKRKTSKVRSLIYAVGYLDVSFPVAIKISVYSPETCRYIPKWLNLIFRRKSDGSLREIKQAA